MKKKILYLHTNIEDYNKTLKRYSEFIQHTMVISGFVYGSITIMIKVSREVLKWFLN